MEKRKLIQYTILVLKENLGVPQNLLVAKLNEANIIVSTSALTKMKQGDTSVGLRLIKKVQKECVGILEKEHNTFFDEARILFYQKTATGEMLLLPKTFIKSKPEKKLIHFTAGRWEPKQKSELIATAEREIIEIGVRLNSLDYYLNNRKKEVFRSIIEDKLKQKINYHCYMLDAKAKNTQAYFADRGRCANTEAEKNSLKGLPRILENLLNTKKELDKVGTGKMHLYTYDSFPTANIIAIDRNSRNGQLLVSPYLYGVSRRESPVFLLKKQENKELFDLYNQTVESVRSISKEVTN